MAYDVATGLLRGNIISDDVLAVCRKIVANFYKVQYEHMKRDVAGCV